MSEWKSLKSVSSVITKGTTPMTIGAEFTMEGINFVKSESIADSKYLNSAPYEHIDEETHRKLRRSALQENDLLFSIAGAYLGKLALVRREDLPANTNQAVAIVRLNKKEVDVNYIYYYFLQEHVNSYINKLSSQSSQPNLNLELLGRLVFKNRSIESQQKIAAVLSSLDAKIELNNRINAELEAMAKTLYDYWFVQFDFPDVNGKPYKSSSGKMVWNEELKREIPEGWEKGLINDLGKIVAGGTPSTNNPDFFTTNGIAWITPRDLSMTSNKYIKRGETDITELGLKNSSAKLMPANSVLLTSRAPIGYVAISLNEVCTNQGFKSIVPHNKFGTEYVYYTILSLVPLLQILGTGSTFREISKEVFANVPVFLPNEEILKKFKELIQPIAIKRINAETENQQLTELRDWLLPMLMNGQVKVADETKLEEIETPLSMAAEPVAAYQATPVKVNVSEIKKPFARRVLGGKIVSLFKDDRHFTHIKFQKLQFLAEHIIGADLRLNYYFQAAGPYDPAFMNTVIDKLKESGWYEERNYKFYPLGKEAKIEDYYQEYFGNATEQLQKLFSLLVNTTEAETEIIATVYAVWNNRIIKQQPISDDLLIEDFYNWSERKKDYTREQIEEGLQWLRINGFMPTGFGKEIKKAKTKS